MTSFDWVDFIQNSVCMKRPKRIDFSNIYSPKNMTILKSLSPTQNISPRWQEKSKRGEKSPAISDVDATQYKRILAVRLPKERVAKIKETMQIQQISKTEWKKRMSSTDKMFLNYNRNQFMTESMEKIKKTKIQMSKSQEKPGLKPTKKKVINIVEGLTMLKERNLLDDMINRTDKFQSQAKAVGRKLQKQILLQQIMNKRKQKERVKQFLEKATMQNTEKQKCQLQLLDDIVNIKQDNYFITKLENKQINIFQLITIQKKGGIQFGNEMLQELHFSHDSIIVKGGKFCLQIYKQISKMSRLMLRNKQSHLILSQYRLSELDLNFNRDNLLFQNLVMIIKGEVSPECLLKYLIAEDNGPKDEEQDQISAEQSQELHLLKDNQQNKPNIFGNQNLTNAELTYYQMEPFSNLEEKQLKLSNKYQLLLKKVLHQTSECYMKNIKDLSIQRNLADVQEKLLQRGLQASADPRNAELISSVERKIRLNKFNKNCSQKLRINILIETLKMKKKMDGELVKQNKKKLAKTMSFGKID